MWEIVNRERKRRRRINEDIGMEDWKEYFARLGGVRVVRGDRGGKGQGHVDEEGISRKEIKDVLGKIKEGKAMGGGELPGEVWKYEGERFRGVDMEVL